MLELVRILFDTNAPQADRNDAEAALREMLRQT